MAGNFNCTLLFSPYLKGSIVTRNVLTLIQKQINKEMFLQPAPDFTVLDTKILVFKKNCGFVSLPWYLAFAFFLL